MKSLLLAVLALLLARQRPPHFIIAQPEIKSLADFKGKLIGVVSMQEGTTFFERA
jgi:hypothetical protein